MKRILAWLFPALLLVMVVTYLARNFIARTALEVGVTHQTGARCDVGSVDVDLFGGRFELRALRLMNPPGFPERAFLDLPSLRVEYDTLSILRRTPHIRSLAIDVKEVFVATNENGERNATKLASTAGDGAARRKKKAVYRVDVLRIHVGTVLMQDDSHGKRTQRRLTLNTQATYRNVSESTDLSRLVLGTVFNQLGPALGDAAKGLGEAVKGGGSNAGKAGRTLLDVFKKKP